MPHLQAVYNSWAARGLVMLTVDSGEKASAVDEFMKKNGYTLPVLIDADRQVALKYNANRIPITFFIGKDGIIKVVKLGAFTSKEQIEASLSKIM